MDYVTQYYKNLSEQLQQRVNILTRKVKYLTEAGPVITDDGNEGSGNVTATPISPFGPGGYFYPSQLNPPTQNPNQSPSISPYDGPGPVLPGHYSPAPPISYDEWLEEWPELDPDNYEYGRDDPEYKKDKLARDRSYLEMMRRWHQWRRERAGGAGRVRLPGFFS
jgi:hypothetical protein